jgi:serine/threonine protein kinase
MTNDAFPDGLPNKFRLHWYVLERVLGQGGFGITYLAHDTNLDRAVAIKEYLPNEAALRRSDSSVRPRTEALAERYRWGLERFIGEAQTLAHFDHPNIVRVHAVFEANDTAYMVMRFEEGDNLGQILEQRGTLPEPELLRILLPILDGLQIVHDAKFIHRDIKPENIHIRHDGSPVLLDFGSARQSLNRTHTMTILVARGYAPLEQYYGDSDTQGPWTDIYSLAATCYRAMTGSAPADALERIKGVLGSVREVLTPAADIARGRYSAHLLRAIDHALELNEKDRPQSIAEWRREIVGNTEPERFSVAQLKNDDGAATKSTAPSAQGKVQSHSERSKLGRTWRVWAAGVASVAAVVFVIFAIMLHQKNIESQQQLEQRRQDESRVIQREAVRKADEEKARRDNEEQQRRAKTQQVKPVTPEAPRPKSIDPRKDSAAQPAPVPERGKASDSAKESTHAETAQFPSTPIVKQEPVAKSPPIEAPVHPTTSELLDKSEAALNRGDYSTALAVIKRFASAGDPRAQALLGSLYEKGLGMPHSAADAYMWYSLSVRAGNAAARDMKAQVAGKLQPAEIRQADRVVDKWRPN